VLSGGVAPAILLHADFTDVFGTYIPPCFGLPQLPGFMTTQQFNSAVSSIALKFLYLAIGRNHWPRARLRLSLLSL